MRLHVGSRALAALAFCVIAAACIDLGSLDTTDAIVDASSDGSPSPEASSDDAAGGQSDAASTDAVATTDDATVDAGPPGTLYSRSDAFKTQWNVVNLDVAWNGVNAPPPRGIIATAQLNKVDRLLVWTDEGKFYVRKGGIWQAPVATTTAFPALAGLAFRGCYHQPDNPSVGLEELVLVANPKAVQYTYSQTDVITFESTVTLSDEAAPYGAPKATKQVQWVVRAWSAAGADAASALAEYSAYIGDPYVYFFDATALPANKWLFADAPLFKGTSNPPPKDDIMSGWRDDAATTFYLIAR